MIYSDKDYLKTIRIKRTVWKKNPTLFDTVYRVSRFEIALSKNRNKPTHTIRIISTGGILSAVPLMILKETGRVED